MHFLLLIFSGVLFLLVFDFLECLVGVARLFLGRVSVVMSCFFQKSASGRNWWTLIVNGLCVML